MRLPYHQQWGDVVSIYANCSLTNDSDRLIAMSGIAKSFQETNQDTYLAGLWKGVIFSDLTWKTNASEGAQVQRSESYAPTWSWASVVGGHITLCMMHSRHGGLPIPLIELVEARIVSEPPGGDNTGLLRSAELDIECMLYHYRWVRKTKKLAVFTDEARTKCYFDKEYRDQDLYIDTTNMVQKFQDMEQVEGVCLPLCGVHGAYGAGTNAFLMLEHVSGTIFKRVGTFQHGEMVKWIRQWSGSGTRITLV
ncbi:heterokaryon incompatibility [Fusarium beomiforme]|uniref:Heterokaryon incompatibility n=1 Tax=Fusarium beomiforme TaxID=44412 RepID=A0A9P5AIG3_9HYPO|nr:heterokaryon incompatibility [Fusarium beomiforme]